MEKRIWNKSELEQMDEWSEYGNGVWTNFEGYYIVERTLGKPVQWCKEQGYTVTSEMIAKTPCLTMGELTERLDKGEICITLENGTTITVGGKYFLEVWNKGLCITVLFIYKDCLFCELNNRSHIGTYNLNEDWLPYTEPKEEPKPLEGYQKWYIHLSGKSNRVRIEYMTIAKSLELRKSTHILGVYTETEAIELGLPI